MAQHGYNIINQLSSQLRDDLNFALEAISSTNSGSTEPPTSFNNQLWYDTGTNTLKLKEEVGSDWISIGYFDQGSGAFSLFDDTKLVDTSGNQTGLLGDQLPATWVGGTGTLQSLVSPANVKASIVANVPASPVKAWVSFNGTGAVSIRDSFNVSSVTDTGVGSYVVNFTTNLSSVNYAAVASVRASSGAMFANIHNGSGTSFPFRPPQVSSYAISVTNRTNYAVDGDYVASAVFGN